MTKMPSNLPAKLKPTKDITAVICDNGLFCELAVTLAETYKKVYYHVPQVSAFPKRNLSDIGKGLKGIEVIQDLLGNDFDDEVDLYVFPDVGFGKLQVHLESLGKKVWGSREGEICELDRVWMKEKMKELGLPVGPYKVVNGMQALREHLKKNKDQHVKISRHRGSFETFFSPNYKFVEPKLDEIEYTLGAFKHDMQFIVEDDLPDRFEIGSDMYCIDGKFPTQLIAGPEIKDLGFVGVFKKRSEFPKELTHFDDVIAPLMKEFRYRGFYSTELRIGNDKKSFMIDHCFDDQTEVLTERGWLPFRECLLLDKMATLNVATGQIEYQHPENLISKPYQGEMVRITNDKQSIDCVVTPDHSVLRYDRYKKKLFKEPASDLTDKGFIPRTGRWTPTVEITHFTLPEYHSEWDFIGRTGKKICTRIHHDDAIKIPINEWAAFLGWYLSEGSLSTTGPKNDKVPSSVNISQTKHTAQVRAVLERLPFKFSQDAAGFRISSCQLAHYLKVYGLCGDKFIPDYILHASRETIRIFLDNFCLGDGSQRGKRKLYYTTSKRLADGLQELIFKSGAVANLQTRFCKGTEIRVRDKTYTRKKNSIVLQECTEFTDFWFETGKRADRYIKRVHYSGNVYCATVPNGTLYVRRSGKPFWSGNCSRAASPPNELYQLFYRNLADIIWQGANGICIDPVPAGKYGAEALIHSSWADANFQPLEIPEEIKPYVKLRNAMFANGRYYTIPQAVGLPEIGAVVGYGNTLQGAIDMVTEIAEQIKGYYIEIKTESFEKAEEEIAKGEEYGIKMF